MKRLNYKIFTGFDTFKNIKLYRVQGVNNEYVGEWHIKDFDAFSEWLNLDNKEDTKKI